MDNNVFNTQNTMEREIDSGMESLTNQPTSGETVEPNQTDIVFNNKSDKKRLFVGVICGLVGLIIGGAGVFGIIKLMGNSDNKCPECSCPQCNNKETAQNGLDFAFLKLEATGQNIVYSPLSIRYGLSLLNAGAAGNTKTQIESVLGDAELPKYENVADKMSLANAVFIKNSFADTVLESYTDAVTSQYNSEIIYDSFESTDVLDNWVSEKTFNLINRIGEDLTPDVVMVLANALAIQLDWQYQFSRYDTGGRPFYKEDGTEIIATSMNNLSNEEDVKYYLDDETTALIMPLQAVDSTELEFIAIMPNNKLENYIDSIEADTIEGIIEKSISTSTPELGVEIFIPKFKFDYKLKLKDDLISLGVTDAFNTSADFSKMASGSLNVSDAVHNTTIDFSEEGIKAAAVTALYMTEGVAAESEKVVIDINKPFLFLIRDKNNGTIWFTGAVYEPNLWENEKDDYRRA